MDKEWSGKNKEIQTLLSRETTFREAVGKLIEFRQEMFEQITRIVDDHPDEAFSQMPFAGADGYHSKTLAYSIWHIFRIEDIVAHEMIAEDRQILFDGGFDQSVHSPIITTGNELSGAEIAAFSGKLDIRQLYRYAEEVMQSTNQILLRLDYSGLKRKFGEEMKEKLRQTGCISRDEEAYWLIDYWCGKDVKGLIKMPFSRHWIMHIEAMRRIESKLGRTGKKGGR